MRRGMGIAVLVVMLAALAGWAEVSYQEIVIGTLWEDIPFLEDMELTEQKDALIPGRIYRRSGEVLGYTTEELWYEWEGKVQVIMVTMDSNIRNPVRAMLEKRYGENQTTGSYEYVAMSGEGIVWFRYHSRGVTLIYMTLKILEAGAAMEEEREDAAGL